MQLDYFINCIFLLITATNFLRSILGLNTFLFFCKCFKFCIFNICKMDEKDPEDQLQLITSDTYFTFINIEATLKILHDLGECDFIL